MGMDCVADNGNRQEVVYWHPHIAFYDTKPDCIPKINRLNRYERSAILKTELKKLQQEKEDNKNKNIAQQNQTRKRLNRKRKRATTDKSSNALNMKRRKRSTKTSARPPKISLNPRRRKQIPIIKKNIKPNILDSSAFD